MREIRTKQTEFGAFAKTPTKDAFGNPRESDRRIPKVELLEEEEEEGEVKEGEGKEGEGEGKGGEGKEGEGEGKAGEEGAMIGKISPEKP